MNEWRWWQEKRVNGFTLAMTLHDVTGDREAAERAIELHRS